mgnify:CR=1 FL=1
MTLTKIIMLRARYILILSGLLGLLSCAEKAPVQFEGRTMGTSYLVKIADFSKQTHQPQTVQSKIDSVLILVNGQMSTYLPNSEISRFNRPDYEGAMFVSPAFMQVLCTARQIYDESHGAFDPTVGPLVNLWGFGPKGMIDRPPPQAAIDSVREFVGFDRVEIIDDSTIAKQDARIELDLNAIAKGYGVDVVAELLSSLGYRHFLVEIGGEVVVRGLKGDKKWRVGVDRPRFGAVPGQDLETIIGISDAALATSGDYRNYFVSDDQTYSHTIDPLTGRPIVNGVASATVIAPNCMLADAMATAIMVMGAEKGLAWVESKEGVEALIILRRGERFEELFSSGFKNYLVKK